MSHTAKVFNHGSVQLVDSMGNDLSIVKSARVSFDQIEISGQDQARDAKLISYLMDNGHNTPFESVVAQFQITAPIFVIRQWQRHRTQSYNEVSGRYTELSSDFFVPDIIGVKDKHNSQRRELFADNPNADKIKELIHKQSVESVACYNQLLEIGCPKELARIVLPLGTYTSMIATANLHNWFGFLKERLANNAQYEIHAYACEILKALRTIAPIACNAFHSKHCITFITSPDYARKHD